MFTIYTGSIYDVHCTRYIVRRTMIQSTYTLCRLYEFHMYAYVTRVYVYVYDGTNNNN